MNENAKKWIAALRSGEFKQAVDQLEHEGSYCCLGVACVLANREGVCGPLSEGYCEGESYCLPSKVREWLGVASSTGEYYRDGCYGMLTDENDNGATFEEIAGIIESEPEGLFVP